MACISNHICKLANGATNLSKSIVVSHSLASATASVIPAAFHPLDITLLPLSVMLNRLQMFVKDLACSGLITEYFPRQLSGQQGPLVQVGSSYQSLCDHVRVILRERILFLKLDYLTKIFVSFLLIKRNLTSTVKHVNEAS